VEQHLPAQPGTAADPGGWLLLSDRPEPQRPRGLLTRGSFVLELQQPPGPATVLVDQAARDGQARHFAVALDLAEGLTLTQLQGRTLLRHLLPGPLPRGDGPGRLTFAFDAGQRFWSLAFEQAGDPDGAVRAAGASVLPLDLADLAALCAAGPGTRRHPSVLWFGATAAICPPRPGAWLGLRAPVDTPSGPVPAGSLRPGDRVQTLDRGPLAVRRIRPVAVPSAGSAAPVLLRAPYFPRGQDLQVGPAQLLLYEGVAAQYLFGEEAVLVRACDLCDGTRATPDHRRAEARGVEIDLGTEALLSCDGCALVAPSALRGGWVSDLRRLDAAEARALRAMRRATGRNIAA
jgi:hypothetical protein